MKLFPEIELPRFMCRFENYTQSFEIIQILIYLFAFWGLFHLVMTLWSWFRYGKGGKE